MAFFSDANLEAIRYDFKLRDRCYSCWRRDCNRQGGNKPPRLRQVPMIEDLIRKAAKEYFENISRDEFISDLRKAGFTVYEADQD